ncbi:diacylglycerol kinase catalytic region [Haladaptatus paucihalophilus DX253]|uniref:Diacylglycerol kinase catalytic region n=1 Tax=Haladaptatus paucihalophilus DX253 TaxID=797209 RepID=E7QNK5_HALPU|nr:MULTISPECIES: YegS/Rv2252/BmrU family lipid kinase [Haladaptatus]EFW94075.1 diacylglycerol kinase catalytic region [Haladaptatus paucihalophilus DX253]GKZ13071.1 bis(5'-nucleosyl)-tetraphosphatase [Haladaptatus sp. T7]SHK62529.1 lipid kinase, YegS/Rv2252/BmrU family [Haladaptatus paucihalophilus DX253]
MKADEEGAVDDLVANEDAIEYERVVVLNPVSGNANHREQVQRLATEYDCTVLETQGEGDAREFARHAAENGAAVVAAAGGDGTIHEVVRGLDDADALDAVTFAVIPAGTGNNFAGNVGVTGIEHAFEVLDAGERRRIDLGTTNGRPFVNSCVGGLTADASHQTDPEQKARLGVLAYVVNTLRLMTDYEGLPLTIAASDEGDVTWSGDAVFVLVGNGRRFPAKGRTQANMEDGLLDVTVIEKTPTANLLQEATMRRLFGSETENVTHLKTPALEIAVEQDSPVEFSLDGEKGEWDGLTLGVRPRTMELCVGEEYERYPENSGE